MPELTATRTRQLRRELADLRRQWKATVSGELLPWGVPWCDHRRPDPTDPCEGCATRAHVRAQAAEIETQAAAIRAELNGHGSPAGFTPVSGTGGGETPPPVLDWRHAQHWGGGKTLPCRYCGKAALLRDEAGEPAHKVCAEAALALTSETTAGTVPAGE